MATSSFFIDITIKDKKTAKKFLEAMEKAENAKKKKQYNFQSKEFLKLT